MDNIARGRPVGVVTPARDHSLATNKQCCKASRVFCCHSPRLAHDFVACHQRQRSYKWR